MRPQKRYRPLRETPSQGSLTSADAQVSVTPSGPSATAATTVQTGTFPPPQRPVKLVQSYLTQPLAASFIAGGVAGAVSRTVVSPLERLKIIFQVQGPGNSSYQGVGPALGKMWKEEGWRGFMR
jgi:hypothetical protein